MLKYKNAYLKFVKKQEVPEHRFQNKIEQLDNFYLPICYKLFNYHKYKKKNFTCWFIWGPGIREINYSKNSKNYFKKSFYVECSKFFY